MSLNNLIGYPLDRIVHFIGNTYDVLYATGDSTLRSRIVRSPVNCDGVISKFAQNVVSLDCAVTSRIQSTWNGSEWVDERVFYYTKRHTMKILDIPAIFPATLTELVVSFEGTMGNMLSHLTNLRYLRICNVDIRYMKEGMIPDVKHLELDFCDARMATFIPKSVETLYIHRIWGNVDLSSALFTKITVNDPTHLEKNVAFPPSVTELMCLFARVQQDLPNLVKATVTQLEGNFPSLKTLISGSKNIPSYSGRDVHFKLGESLARKSDGYIFPMNMEYRNGHLICDFAEYFAEHALSYPVTDRKSVV